MTNEELKARYDSLRVQGTKTNKKRTEEDLRARYNYLQQMQQPVAQPTQVQPIQTTPQITNVTNNIKAHGTVTQQPNKAVQAMNLNSINEKTKTGQKLADSEIKALALSKGISEADIDYAIGLNNASKTPQKIMTYSNLAAGTQITPETSEALKKGTERISNVTKYKQDYGAKEANEEAEKLDWSDTNSEKYVEYKEKLKEAEANNDYRNISKYNSLINNYQKKYKENFGDSEQIDVVKARKSYEAWQNTLSNDYNNYLKATTPEQKQIFAQELLKDKEEADKSYKKYTDALAYDELINNNILKDTASSFGKNVLGGTANIINGLYTGGGTLTGLSATSINPEGLLLANSGNVGMQDVGNALNKLNPITGLYQQATGQDEGAVMSLSKLSALAQLHPENKRLQNLFNQIATRSYQGTKEDLANELNTIQTEIYQNFKDVYTQDELDAVAEQLRHNEIYGDLAALPNAFGTVGNMTPSILLGTATGGLGELAGAGSMATAGTIANTLQQVGSLGSLGVGAYSQGMDQALQEGANYKQAQAYGALTGATEVGTEMLGGETVNQLFGRYGKTALGKVFGKAIDNLNIESKVGKFIANQVSGVASEMTEEMISEALNPLWKAVTYNPEALPDNLDELGEYFKNILNAGVEAIPSTLLMQGGGLVMQANNVQTIENGIIDSINNDTELSQIAKNQLINEVRKASREVKLGIEEADYMTDKMWEKNAQLTAQSEQMKQRIPEGYSLPQSTIDILSYTENNRPGLNIAFDTNIQGNGTFVENPDGTRTITLNPNSKRAVEFTLTHELGHDLKGTGEYTQLQNLLTDYAKGKPGYQEALNQLDKTYKESGASYNLQDEATNDMLGQAIGEQEFYNKLAENPTLFNRVTNGLKNLLGNKDTKLKNKIEKLTSNALKQEYRGKQEGTQQSLSDEEIRVNYKGENRTYRNYLDYAKDISENNNDLLDTLLMKHRTYNFEIPADKNEIKLYHGTDSGVPYRELGIPEYEAATMDRNYGDYFYTFNNKDDTISYGNVVAEFIIPKDKVLSYSDYLKSNKKADELFNDYWAIEQPDEEYIIKDVNKIRDYTLAKADEYLKKNNTQYSLSEAPTMDNQGRELSEGQQTYFKDSKVRDSEGRLLEVYHGTPTKEHFTVFDKNKAGSNVQADLQGIYFTDSPEFADQFAHEQLPTNSMFRVKLGEKGQVYKSYLNITNPLDLNNLTDEKIEELYNYVEDEWLNLQSKEQLINDMKTAAQYNNAQFIKLNLDFSKVQQAGYDGMIANLGRRHSGNEYIVFNSNQIKDIDNLNPTENEDIRYQKQNQSWQGFLDNTYGKWNTGTRTNFEGLPSNEELQQAERQSVKEEPVVKLLESDDPTLFSLTEEQQKEVDNYAKDLEKDNTIDQEFKKKVLREFNKIKDYVDFEKIKKEVSDYKSKPTIDKSKLSQMAQDRIASVENFIADLKTSEGTRGLKLKGKDVKEVLNKNVPVEKGNSKVINNTIKAMNEDMYNGTLTDSKIDEYVESLGENMRASASEYYDYYKDLKRDLKNTKIYVTPEVKRGITDYGDFRKRNMGNLTLTTDSNNATIDQVYKELQESYPEMLPDDIYNPIDQLEYVAELADGIRVEHGKLSDMLEKQYGREAWTETAKQLKQDLKDLRDSQATRTEDEGLDIPPDEKKRRWTNTSKSNDLVREFLDVKDLTYVPDSNKKQLNNANAQINRLGYDEAIKYIDNKVNLNERFTANDIAMGEVLIQEAIKRGDFEKAQDLISDVAIIGTDLGQAVQALSLISRMTPEGQLKHLNKVVNKINESIDNRNKNRSESKQLENVKIDPELAENILKATNEEELQQAMDAALQRIADQMPVSFGDKVAEWRYMSMLTNPRTHFRNMLANVAMRLTYNAKNQLQRALETVASPILEERTRTYKKATEDVEKFARQSMKDNAERLAGSKERGIESQLKERQKIFKNKALEWTRKKNSKALSWEDNLFTNNAYRKNLAEYLTANGIKTQHDIDMNPELVQKGINFAMEEAFKTTFHQASKLASELNRIENINGLSKLVVGGIVPFKKTPINIAKTGAAYSPLGFIETLTNETYKLKKGDITANQWIDRLSQGLTGTAIMALGYAMSKMGWVKGSTDKDEEYEENIGKTKGYSLRFGDVNYDISWLAPSAMPFLMGAELADMTEGKDASIGDILEALGKTTDPISEMSLLQGVGSALKSYSNSDSTLDYISTITENAISSYLGQFLPTIGGQANKIIDDTQRITTASKDSSWRKGESFARQQLNKMPGGSFLLEPKTDVWGNEVKRDSNPAVRAFEALINPGTVTKDNTTPVDEEILSVFSETGEEIKPKIPKAEFTYNKEKIKLNAKDYTTYKKTVGQYMYDNYEALLNSEAYNSKRPEKKAKILKKIADDSINVGKAAVGTKTADYTKYDVIKDELDKAGIPLADYYLFASEINGNTKKSTKQTIIKQNSDLLNEKNGKDTITSADKKVLYDIFGLN